MGSLTLVKNKYIVLKAKTDVSINKFVSLVEDTLNSHFGFKADVSIVDRKKDTFRMTFKHKKERINFNVVLMMHIKK